MLLLPSPPAFSHLPSSPTHSLFAGPFLPHIHILLLCDLLGLNRATYVIMGVEPSIRTRWAFNGYTTEDNDSPSLSLD